MPQQISTSVENNFTKGLITESTGLNFPENAAFDTDNCIYTLVGDVIRREGFDYEANFVTDTVNRTGKALNTYKWNNVGGDGETQIIVRQIGSVLYFYQSSNATLASPLSTTKLSSTVNFSSFLATGGTNDPSVTECQFTDGNGFLFVYHPDCEPFYCTYNAGIITATPIIIKIRDFTGIDEGLADNARLTSLNIIHKYNLINQGWTSGNGWGANDVTSVVIYQTGVVVLTVAAGLPIVIGDQIDAYGFSNVLQPLHMNGNVTNYVGTTLTLNITSLQNPARVGTPIGFPVSGIQLGVIPINFSLINSWNAALGTYPSNADVWWRFKNSSNVFDPATTINNVTLGSGPAAKGFSILNAFGQDRNSIVNGLTTTVTTVRPKTGTWFQGRVWYSGVDDSFQASGNAPYYTWTENIYFSQIITNSSQFGRCYQTNDPTSEEFFDLLPTDGGVIVIQGSGSVYRLFPVQNGLLVFAANGIWFITGSQGIGFAANDYTITKISGIQTTSSTSFVNVMGYPIFWNEEGIYSVAPGQTGGLVVNNLALGTILTYYSNIPLKSKKFARGDYNPIDYTIQWCFRSTDETSVTNRYEFDKILCFNVSNKAFYPYSLNGAPHIHDVRYVAGPGGSTSPSPIFKYLTSVSNTGTYNFTFSEERDSNHLDWFSFDSIGTDYTSFFITGYKLRGQGQRLWQPGYVYLFLRNDVTNGYTAQGQWDFGISRSSGKWSQPYVINDTTDPTRFGVIHKRHKFRGHGLVFQMKISSITGRPFDIVGWSIFETQNQAP